MDTKQTVVAVRLSTKQIREVDAEIKRLIKKEGKAVSRGEYFRRLHIARKAKG